MVFCIIGNYKQKPEVTNESIHLQLLIIKTDTKTNSEKTGQNFMHIMWWRTSVP